MTGVYKAQCAGDRRQCHLHGNKETEERVLMPAINNNKKLGCFNFLQSAGVSVRCLMIFSGIKGSSRTKVPQTNQTNWLLIYTHAST